MFKREPFGVLLNLGYLLGKLEWTANDNSRPTYLHLKQLLHILKTYPGELDEFVGLWAALDMLEKHQQAEPRSRVPELGLCSVMGPEPVRIAAVPGRSSGVLR